MYTRRNTRLSRTGGFTCRCLLVAFVPALLLSPASMAAKWSIEPVLDVQEVYTDNLSLTPSALKDEDFITVITPGISFNHEGNRIQGNLDYSMQNLLYAYHGSRNQQLHLVQADSSSEILEERFFLDLSMNRSTQNINNTGNTGTDNLSVSGDRASVLSYRVSPYYRQRFGSLMDIDVRYSRDDVDSKRLQGSSADDFTVNLSSGSDFSRLLWDIDFSSHVINNESGETTRTRYIKGKLRYLFSRKLAAVAELGYDNNSFESVEGDVSGELWNVGAEWNPSTRTSLEASFGRRFFGNDLRINFNHRSKRSRTGISFTREPSNTRATLLEQQAFILTDAFGDPIIDPVTRDISTINVNVPVQSTEVLIRSRFNGVFTYNLRKHTFNVSANYEELDYQESGETEFSRRLDASWMWSLFTRTSVTAYVSWSKDNRRSGADDRYLIAQFSLAHVLSPGLEVSIGTRLMDRNSNIIFREYRENRLFANLNKTF